MTLHMVPYGTMIIRKRFRKRIRKRFRKRIQKRILKRIGRVGLESWSQFHLERSHSHSSNVNGSESWS